MTLGQECLPRPKPPPPTLADYYQGYLDTYLVTAVRESTRISYEGSFRLHILPELGSCRLDELTRDRAKQFVAHLMGKKLTKVKREQTRGQNGQSVIKRRMVEYKLSRPSIRIIVSELSAVLNHAVEDGVIAQNPASRLGRYYKQAHGGA